MKKIILGKILYYSKKERDARVFRKYELISNVIKSYSDEELMATYFNAKEKEEYSKNIITLFFVGIIFMVLANITILYGDSLSSLINILLQSELVMGISKIELFKVIVILLLIIFASMLIILVLIIHANIKSFSETKRYILQLEHELERRKSDEEKI